MLNFKVAAPNKSSKPSIYLARFVDEQWFVKIVGILIPIKIPNIKTSTVLYSLPSNDKHEPWTERKIKAGSANDIAINSWSTLYHGQRMNGYVKGNVFYITKLYGK